MTAPVSQAFAADLKPRRISVANTMHGASAPIYGFPSLTMQLSRRNSTLVIRVNIPLSAVLYDAQSAKEIKATVDLSHAAIHNIHAVEKDHVHQAPMSATDSRFRAPASAIASTTTRRVMVSASASNIGEQAVPTKRGDTRGHGVKAKLLNSVEDSAEV